MVLFFDFKPQIHKFLIVFNDPDNKSFEINDHIKIAENTEDDFQRTRLSQATGREVANQKLIRSKQNPI